MPLAPLYRIHQAQSGDLFQEGDTTMFTRSAIALALIVGITSSALAATTQPRQPSGSTAQIPLGMCTTPAASTSVRTQTPTFACNCSPITDTNSVCERPVFGPATPR